LEISGPYKFQNAFFVGEQDKYELILLARFPKSAKISRLLPELNTAAILQ
jgi:hypothetical protein